MNGGRTARAGGRLGLGSVSEPLPAVSQPSPDPRYRTPRASAWSLKLSGWLWAASGALFALGPLLSVLLLWAQYASLRRQAVRLAGLADSFDADDLLQIEHYLAEFERIEAIVVDASAWVLVPALILYLLFAAVSLTGYILLGRRTALGDNWARITATVLACLSTPLVFLVWQGFAALSWLPVDALWANHIGLVLIALHTAGVVFAWLPASNAYVRQRRAERAAARAAAPHYGAAPQP